MLLQWLALVALFHFALLHGCERAHVRVDILLASLLQCPMPSPPPSLLAILPQLPFMLPFCMRALAQGLFSSYTTFTSLFWCLPSASCSLGSPPYRVTCTFSPPLAHPYNLSLLFLNDYFNALQGAFFYVILMGA